MKTRIPEAKNDKDEVKEEEKRKKKWPVYMTTRTAENRSVSRSR